MELYDYVCRICPQAQDVMRFIRDAGCRWMFGCGQQAVNCNYIFGLLGIHLDGCMATKPRQKYFMGIPLLPAESPEIPRSADVLVAVGGKASAEIKTELQALGYSSIYTCANWERTNDAVKEAVFWEFCRSNAIHTEGAVIQLGGITLLNPFKYPWDYSQLLYGTTFSGVIVPGIFASDRYGNAELYARFYKRAGMGKGVYDVGAGIGVFGAMAAARGCRVTAFEPSRSALRYLYENAELSADMVIEEYAVCDVTGDIDFYDRESYSKYSTIIPTDGYSRYSVAGLRLDEYISGQGAGPDIIRIAVDEVADRILSGAREYISAAHPDLMIAVTSEEACAKVRDMLRDFYSGYIMEQYSGWIYVYEK